MKNKRTPLNSFIIAVIAILLTILIAGPFVFMILTTFKQIGEVMRFPPKLLPDSFYLQNYVKALHSYIPRAFLNSLFVSAMSVIVTLLLSLPAAYAFSRLNFPGRNFFFMLTLSTMMIPQGLLVVPMFNIMKNMPLVSSEYGWIDTFPGLIFPFLSIGFITFYVRQYFLGIPRSLDEAARIDGANKLQVFFMVILPLAKPALSLAVIFSFMNKWNDYLWPMAIIRSENHYTIQIAIKMFQGQFNTDWPMMLTGATVSVIPILILYVAFQKGFEQGLSGVSAGMKE